MVEVPLSQSLLDALSPSSFHAPSEINPMGDYLGDLKRSLEDLYLLSRNMHQGSSSYLTFGIYYEAC